MCTPYDGPHGLPLLVIGETDLQIVVKIVAFRLGTVTPAAAGVPEAREDGSDRGLERVGHGRGALQGHGRGGHGGHRLRVGVVRGGARPPLGTREDRLEGAPPEAFEYDPVCVFATRRSAPLHLNLTTTNGRLGFLC